ncbi:UrcA family protein [Caulobacter sp. SL161]|uniref:UrcA family protein n=1 Tax=Caulobacter sp. SL161 TaxID=2995156 RepID=UPI002275B044|nr:UrcA family protein [Caulobacter sp. SL161]MCY1645610.1 UrcA family protein [Caulobacter sp. SL161]
MRKFIMSLTTVATLSLAAVPVLGLTQAANASESDPRVSIAVSDLNLSNPAQAALFKARVQQAGETLCRAKLRNNTLDMSFGQCRMEVQREAERQLSKPQRQALIQAKRATTVELAAQ